jgi:hypothetical protein
VNTLYSLLNNNNNKWLYILKHEDIFLQFLKFLKSIHYQLVSYFCFTTSFAYTVLQQSVRHESELFSLTKEEERKSYLEFIAPVHHMSLPSMYSHWPNPTKTNHMNTFGLSATPSPPTSKMVLRPLTYGKRKMWRCSVLHEVQLFKSVPLRNKAKHKPVKHSASYRHCSLCLVFTVTTCISRVLISTIYWLRTTQSLDFVHRLQFQKYKE